MPELPTAPEVRERMPGTVWALGAVSLFTDIGGEMVFPLLPKFLAGLSSHGAEAVGVIEGTADAISHVVKPFIGSWSDRIEKRKPFVVLGYGISGAVRPILGIAMSVYAAGFVRAGDRLGKGIRGAPRDALIAGSVSRERQARAFALQQAMDNTGAIFGPLLAASLIAWGVSVRQVFLCSAIPGVLAFLTVLIFVREAAFGGSSSKTPPPPETPATVPGENPIADGGSRAPLPPRLRSYFAILFLFALGGSTDALLLLRAGQLGLDEKSVAAAWVVLNIVKVLSNVPGGVLADKFGPVRSIVGGWIVYGAVYLGFAFATGPLAAWGLFATYGLYYGLSEGAEKAIVSRMVTPATRGRAFGMLSFVMGVGTLIASFGTGYLYRHAGPGWAFGIGGAAAVLAAVLLAIWSFIVPAKDAQGI